MRAIPLEARFPRPTPRGLLWTAMAAALAASLTHVAATFGGLEPGGAPAWLAKLGPTVAITAAVAIDLGLAALAWSIGAKRRAGLSTWDLWAGVAIFAALSILANIDHGLVLASGGKTGVAAWSALDWWSRAKVVLLAGALPVLVMYLARTVEGLAEAEVVTTTARPGHAPAGTTVVPAPSAPATTVSEHRPRPRVAMATDPAVTMAIAAGVPRTTARRWSATGDPRLDQYRPPATANGHAPSA